MSYSGWAIVEMMGYNRCVGRVSEVVQYGTTMMQIDPIVPGVAEMKPMFVGGASLFRLTPCSEEEARADWSVASREVPLLAPYQKADVEDADDGHDSEQERAPRRGGPERCEVVDRVADEMAPPSWGPDGAPGSGCAHEHGHAAGCLPGATPRDAWGCVPGCPTLETIGPCPDCGAEIVTYPSIYGLLPDEYVDGRRAMHSWLVCQLRAEQRKSVPVVPLRPAADVAREMVSDDRAAVDNDTTLASERAKYESVREAVALVFHLCANQIEYLLPTCDDCTAPAAWHSREGTDLTLWDACEKHADVEIGESYAGTAVRQLREMVASWGITFSTEEIERALGKRLSRPEPAAEEPAALASLRPAADVAREMVPDDGLIDDTNGQLIVPMRDSGDSRPSVWPRLNWPSEVRDLRASLARLIERSRAEGAAAPTVRVAKLE